MKTKQFLIRLAIVNVLQKRFRAFLTIGGIAVSAGVMVLLFGLGSGLQHMVTTQITHSSLQNVITVDTLNAADIPLNQTAVSRIQSISGVSKVEQIVNLSGEIIYNGISLYIPVYGVSGDYFELSPLTAIKGSIGDSMQRSDHKILLSSGAIEALGVGSLGVGKHVTVHLSVTADNDSTQVGTIRDISANDFTVAAVVDKGSAPVAYVPAEYLFQHKINRSSEFKVQMNNPQDLSSIRTAIERLGYQTSSVQDSIAQVNKIFNVIRSILVVFGLITILVTVFGTVNTITIQLIEETRQIGFLRVFGIKRDDVGLLFIVQSVFLAVSGSLAGIVLGLIGGLCTNGIIASATHGASVGSSESVYVYQIPTIPIIIILVLSVAMGWAIGIFPARRAVAINPIAALRS